MIRNTMFYLTSFSVISLLYIILCLSICSLRDKINSPSLISLFYQFAIAYIITFGFYYITVHIKERKDTVNIDEYVIPRSQNIIGDGYKVFNELAKKAGVPHIHFPCSQDELKDILEKINPLTPDAPMINLNGAPMNWVQFLYTQKLRSQEFIKKILDRMPFLNTDLVRIITKIDDCDYFGQIQALAVITIPMRNTDMTFMTGSFARYFEEINNLSLFIEQTYGKKTRYDDVFLPH